MKLANEHSNRLHRHKNIFRKFYRQCQFPLLPPLHKHCFCFLPTFLGESLYVYCRTPAVPIVLLWLWFYYVIHLWSHVNLQFLGFLCHICLRTDTWELFLVTRLHQKECKKIPHQSVLCTPILCSSISLQALVNNHKNPVDLGQRPSH